MKIKLEVLNDKYLFKRSSDVPGSKNFWMEFLEQDKRRTKR